MFKLKYFNNKAITQRQGNNNSAHEFTCKNNILFFLFLIKPSKKDTISISK